MSVFDTRHQRAAWLIALLGVVLVIALFPYASGVLGAPVLYVVFAKVHVRLTKRLNSAALASVAVIIMALVVFVLPMVWLLSLLVGQAQGVAKGILDSGGLNQLDDVSLGGFPIGEQLRQAGTEAISFLGGSAISLVGTVTHMILNLIFTFAGLYYLLMDPDGAWQALRSWIPFSDANAVSLKERFEVVTKSTILGAGLSAVIQGVLIGLAFVVVGLGNPLFWGAVVALFSILPVVGSSLVWIPAAIALLLKHQPERAIGMVIFGIVMGAIVDHVVRPAVSRRYADIHPLITLIGAVAGVSYFGILGLLIGPLALSYFFELLTMYQKEYLNKA